MRATEAGSERDREPLSLEAFIARLERFARQDFPVREVQRFLESIPLEPGALDPYLHFAPDQYTRNLVYKSDDFELLAICWGPGQSAPVHGHEGEKCWSRVERGRLIFSNYREIPREKGFEMEILLTEEGEEGHVDGPADIHKVDNPFSDGAVSLHLYSKPYQACDVYDLEERCKVRKEMSYFSRFGKRCG